METVDTIALFVHVMAALVVFGAGMIGHLGLVKMRSAPDVATIGSWMGTARTMRKLLGPGALLILVSGGHLVDRAFSWSDGWVLSSLVGLVLIEVAGGALMGPRLEALGMAAHQAPDGPVTPALRARVVDPVLWVVSHAITGAVVGIVYLMVDKPSAVVSVAVVAGTAVVGALTARPVLRREVAAAPAVRHAA